MIRRLLIACLIALPVLPAAAQAVPPENAAPGQTAAGPAAPPQAQPAPDAVPPPPAPDTPKPDVVKVVMTTDLGPITIALETQRAPVTARYILRHVDEQRLDGGAFYRAYKITPDGSLGLVQGGIRDGRKLLPPVAHEPTSKTGLTHDEGAISLARGAPGTAQAQFFIIIGNLSSLDANPAAAGDNQGFAVFGRVTDGMDVVRRILNVAVSPTAGEGPMKGQMIASPVKIISVRRLVPLRRPAVLPAAATAARKPRR